VGDLVIGECGRIGIVTNFLMYNSQIPSVDDKEQECLIARMDRGAFMAHMSTTKIIQRNNQPFIMPESEKL